MHCAARDAEISVCTVPYITGFGRCRLKLTPTLRVVTALLGLVRP
jgi:hypothetical protein